MDIPPAPVLADRLRALPAVVALLSRIDEAEPLFLVGGAVRDVLLGGSPCDLDLVVEGDAAALAAQIGRPQRPRIHDRFGTSTVSLDGFTYDIARARTEHYPHPGALPEVAPASLEDDLRRRDFTVNAIAIGLCGPTAGELHAVPGALDDLKARCLRILHPGSFVDDPTRMFRLVRYASRLGFAIDPATRSLAASAIEAGAVATVGGARLGTEIRLLARDPDPVRALTMLRHFHLDRAIDPDFGLRDADLAQRALALLPSDGRPDLLVLAAACRGLAPARVRSLLARLVFEAGEREIIVAAAAGADEVASGLEAAERPSQIARAVGTAGPEAVALAGALRAPVAARAWLERLRHVRLEIGGDALLAAGVPPGPAVGRGLRAALAAKLDGRAPDADAALAEALRAARDRK